MRTNEFVTVAATMFSPKNTPWKRRKNVQKFNTPLFLTKETLPPNPTTATTLTTVSQYLMLFSNLQILLRLCCHRRRRRLLQEQMQKVFSILRILSVDTWIWTRFKWTIRYKLRLYVDNQSAPLGMLFRVHFSVHGILRTLNLSEPEKLRCFWKAPSLFAAALALCTLVKVML